VRVPGEAGKGNAKVTIHIPDTKGLKVTPAAFAVPLNADPGRIQAAKPWSFEHRK
jgi:hypothetical protein